MPIALSFHRLLVSSALGLAAAAVTMPAAAQFAMVPSPLLTTAQPSQAESDKDYKTDAAKHLYAAYPMRIFKGKMPPLLYAVGVLNVEIDQVGRVTRLDWMRAPNHAPEVVAEIERTVRKAAPFPAPSRMGKVVYTDTWLWHKSGKFQLDTLTEGQN